HASFEEVCHLLWYGDLPDQAALDRLHGRLMEGAQLGSPAVEVVRHAPAGTHPMAILRSAVSALAFTDSDVEDNSAEANERKAIRLTAETVALTAAIERVRRGRDPVDPDPALGLGANLLYMMSGRAPDELHARIMDVALTLHAEHGMNASTFAARVTAGTMADMHSAVTSAIGTLKGPLHGGANERVMRMLQEVAEPGRAAEWVRGALERGEKVMGFGHRVYRTLDPRAPILRELASELAGRGGDQRWLEVSEGIRTAMGEEMEKRQKQIYPNVDFFSASVYFTMGIPMDLFTNLFACARMAGWTAHVMEQHADNRLIRPKGEYVGPEDRKAVPIGQR
ncbi:MAG: citrate/2-methylcitrate synthase, partial [Gemmatimonadota bacterium]